MAPSKKRKRENEKDGSDDFDDTTCGLRQILPVANLPIDFDGEPLDGMQYLFLVRCVLSSFFQSHIIIRNDLSNGSTEGMHGGFLVSST